MLSSNLVFIKGAGDIAMGLPIACPLWFSPMTELEQPTVVRRTVSLLRRFGKKLLWKG